MSWSDQWFVPHHLLGTGECYKWSCPDLNMAAYILHSFAPVPLRGCEGLVSANHPML